MPIRTQKQLEHPGYYSGRYYSTWPSLVGTTTAISAVDTIYLYPFRVYAPISISSILLRLATVGASSGVKTGIWRNNLASGRAGGAPIIVDNTGIDTSSGTGAKTFAVSPAVIMAPGWYWAGTKAKATLPIMAALNAGATFTSFFAGDDTSAPIIAALTFADAYANTMPTLADNAVFAVSAVGGIPVIALGIT